MPPQKSRRSCRAAAWRTTSIFPCEVAADFVDVLADLRVDLQVALEELGLDGALEIAGQGGHHVGDRAAKRHGLASTRLSSISTPSVGRSFVTNLKRLTRSAPGGLGQEDDAVGQELGPDGQRALVDVEVRGMERVTRAVERAPRPAAAGSPGHA